MMIVANATHNTTGKKDLKTISGFERDLNPQPLRYRRNALPTKLSKPNESGHKPFGTFSHLWPLTRKRSLTVRDCSHVALIAQLGEHCTGIAVVGSVESRSKPENAVFMFFLSSSVMAAFASTCMITSTFNCYCWTSLTIQKIFNVYICIEKIKMLLLIVLWFRYTIFDWTHFSALYDSRAK